MHTTVQKIRDSHEQAGGYFFHPDTMRFFDSRIHSRTYPGRIFVTSEQPPHGPRIYAVRQQSADNPRQIDTLQSFIPTAAQAHAYARRASEPHNP